MAFPVEKAEIDQSANQSDVEDPDTTNVYKIFKSSEHIVKDALALYPKYGRWRLGDESTQHSSSALGHSL